MGVSGCERRVDIHLGRVWQQFDDYAFVVKETKTVGIVGRKAVEHRHHPHAERQTVGARLLLGREGDFLLRAGV